MTFFLDVDETMLNFRWKHKKSQIAKINLKPQKQSQKNHNTRIQGALQVNCNNNSLTWTEKQT